MINEKELKIRIEKYNTENQTEYSFITSRNKYEEYSKILEILSETKPDDDPEFHLLFELCSIFEQD